MTEHDAATVGKRPWLGICNRCGTARQEPNYFRLCDERIVLTLLHPPASLSPNARCHWRKKAADTKQFREDVGWVTRSMMHVYGVEGRWPGARLDIHWRYAGVQPDADNCIAQLKGGIDGIADAGLIENDRTIRMGSVTFEHVRRSDREVLLTLTREVPT